MGSEPGHTVAQVPRPARVPTRTDQGRGNIPLTTDCYTSAWPAPQFLARQYKYPDVRMKI